MMKMSVFGIVILAALGAQAQITLSGNTSVTGTPTDYSDINLQTNLDNLTGQPRPAVDPVGDFNFNYNPAGTNNGGGLFTNNLVNDLFGGSGGGNNTSNVSAGGSLTPAVDRSQLRGQSVRVEVNGEDISDQIRNAPGPNGIWGGSGSASGNAPARFVSSLIGGSSNDSGGGQFNLQGLTSVLSNAASSNFSSNTNGSNDYNGYNLGRGMHNDMSNQPLPSVTLNPNLQRLGGGE